MFVLGHVGLTIGLLIVVVLALQRITAIKDPSWLFKIDLRVVAVLAMLPDLLDKFFGHVLLSEDLNNGRIFAHSLLFLLVAGVMFGIGLRAWSWVYTLPLLAHQMFDRMWEGPHTWLWPLLGLAFEKKDYDPLSLWLHELTDPYVIVTEALGLAVIVFIFIYFRMYRKANFLRGLKYGRLTPRQDRGDDGAN